jgi:hypothetical protein
MNTRKGSLPPIEQPLQGYCVIAATSPLPFLSVLALGTVTECSKDAP